MGMGRLVIAVLVAAWFAAASALAYDEATVVSAEQAVSNLTLDLKSLEAGVSSGGISDEQLSKFRSQVEDIRAKATEKIGTLAGPIDEVNQQITLLGPPPGEGRRRCRSSS